MIFSFGRKLSTQFSQRAHELTSQTVCEETESTRFTHESIVRDAVHTMWNMFYSRRMFMYNWMSRFIVVVLIVVGQHTVKHKRRKCDVWEMWERLLGECVSCCFLCPAVCVCVYVGTKRANAKQKCRQQRWDLCVCVFYLNCVNKTICDRIGVWCARERDFAEHTVVVGTFAMSATHTRTHAHQRCSMSVFTFCQPSAYDCYTGKSARTCVSLCYSTKNIRYAPHK